MDGYSTVFVCIRWRCVVGKCFLVGARFKNVVSFKPRSSLPYS
jgi:hypothetical protein